jgi:hypothetical protein
MELIVCRSSGTYKLVEKQQYVSKDVPPFIKVKLIPHGIHYIFSAIIPTLFLNKN